MTMHPLDGARRRMSRAREHFELVQREWDAVPPESKTITLRSEYKADLNKIEVTIGTVPAIDQRWSFEISECLFNLRCALDYLTWELAKWNLAKKGESREPKRQTQYPIATSEQAFNQGQVLDLDPGHATVIKWLQPYSPLHMFQYTSLVLSGANAEGLAQSHAAARLQQANNTDKHRIIEVVAVSAQRTMFGSSTAHDCEIGNINFFPNVGAFKVGAKWVEFDVVRVTGADPRVDVPIEIEPTLSFGGVTFLLDYPRMEAYTREVLQIFDAVWAST